MTTPASAQEKFTPLQPGEAVATRFSGTILQDGKNIIDPEGVVASILDLRRLRQAARGQHWNNEPQRNPIVANDVGQVFGVALDNASPPNIFLTATAKFGLHLGKGDWMEEQWGETGGPGTVYILRAANRYQPEVFAEIALNGRRNTGVALGNITFDKCTNQLFVSDMETGMIHRLDATTGEDRGYFDHGQQGRSNFIDMEKGVQSTLPPVAFKMDSSANYSTCAAAFSNSPDCWNFADHRRRVRGLEEK